MLTTKYTVSSYKDIPETWIFETYLKLEEKLVGQEIKIHSVFNKNDKTPSMCLYIDHNRKYLFKDFSTGKQGNCWGLLMQMYDITFTEAVYMAEKDYSKFLQEGFTYTEIQDYIVPSRYKVTEYKKRAWNSLDVKFWTPFNIGSKLLEEYNIFPLSSYIMSKDEQGKNTKAVHISRNFIYGYFTKEGELYKIYQPKNKDKKFIKVKAYLQGMDQLKKKDYLLITSGLKDTMALKSLKINMDFISPDSENTLIPQDIMEQFINEYKKVIVFLDSDTAGIEAMKKYRELYKTPCVLLTLAKDPADAIKLHKPKTVRDIVVPLINLQL